jgi:hypothetical protein
MGQSYRFDFVNRDGSVDNYEIGSPSDDGDAALRARSAMLVSLTAVAVEVWKDDERLCRIRRDSGPVTPSVGLQALASAPLVNPPTASRRAAYATPSWATAASA